MKSSVLHCADVTLSIIRKIRVASEMAKALTDGIQSQNVGVSMKHFLANNQEKRRMTNSSQVDERTLREIYLAAFEGAVKQAKPWTVMNSYNRINGTYVGESREYLTDILRGEWGFDGYVMSDWGAVNDRVEALKAGMDLEMPASGGINDALIVKAVRDGSLDENVVDQACERILNIIFKFTENRQPDAVFEYEKDHELAAEAEAIIVLLRMRMRFFRLQRNRKLPLSENMPRRRDIRAAEVPTSTVGKWNLRWRQSRRSQK